jgi:hypothetical protein
MWNHKERLASNDHNDDMYKKTKGFHVQKFPKKLMRERGQLTHERWWLVQQLTTQMAHLDVFSHVVECVFLLQKDNVICQALLDSWEESDNLCTIYALLMAPLDTLTVTYGRTYDV